MLKVQQRRQTHTWMAWCGVTCAATEYRVEGPEKTSSGRKKKVQGDFLEEATSKLSGIKKKDIASLEEGRKEGRKERAQGRNRSEKRSVTEEDTGEEDKGLPHTSHCLTGLDNVRPTAQGSFLPSFHQDVRASSATEPRS